MEASKALRGLSRRCVGLLEAAFEVMARYPYDMTELQWNSDLYRPPQDGEGGGRPGPSPRPSTPSTGRAIKVVPPPSSQRYQAARPVRLPARQSRRKQPV